MVIGKYLARLQKKAEDAAQALREKVQEKGGLAAIAKKTTAKTASGIGTIIGEAKDIYHMDEPGYKPVADVYAKKGEAVGTKIADTTGRVATTIADKATELVGEIKAEMADQIFDDVKRTVTIGTKTYPTLAETKTELAEITAYMQQVSIDVPSRLIGREDLLAFIGKRRITSNIGLAKLISDDNQKVSEQAREAAQYVLQPERVYKPIMYAAPADDQKVPNSLK